MKENARIRDINVLSDIKNLSQVRTRVSRFLLEEGIDEPRTIEGIKLAIDEALTNIIKHAYQFQKGKRIDIRLQFSGNRLTVILRDRGRSFSWGEVPEPDLKRYVREEREDGWGIFLIKNLMDEISYCPLKGEHNEMVMIKYLGEEG